MHESAGTAPRPGAPDAPAGSLGFWVTALLDAPAAPLAAGDCSGSWTGSVSGAPLVLSVEIGAQADPGPATRAVDFATRTGTPLVTVLVDGGAPITGAALRDVHLLSGVVPHLAIESGSRTAAGRLRAAAADFSVAISVEREADDPHFSVDPDGAAWARALIGRLPANRTLPAPMRTGTPRARTRELTGAEDPAAALSAISDDGVTPLSAVSSALRCGIAALDGHTIGTIASTAFAGDGSVSAAELRRAARFIGFCDAFRLPLVLALDTPGLAEGADGSAANPLARALAEAATPLVALVTRRLGAPLHDLIADPALVPEALAWPGAAPLPGGTAREIAPERTAAEILAALSRWGGIDAPLPPRRAAVAPR